MDVLFQNDPEAVNSVSDREGAFLLNTAILNRNVGVVKVLIAQPNLDPNLQHGRMATLWIIAMAKEYPLLIQLLINDPRTDVNAIVDGQSALTMAIRQNQFSVVELLVQRSDFDVNRSATCDHPLCLAIELEDEESCRLLLQHPAIDPNQGRGVPPLCLAIESRQVYLVKLLVAHERTNLNIETAFTRTPLHIAVLVGEEEIVSVLLSNENTNPNAKDIRVSFDSMGKRHCIMLQPRKVRHCLIYS
jgi:ankyrin repeat protein